MFVCRKAAQNVAVSANRQKGKKTKKSRKPRFVIVTPRQNDGGPIVLHALCKCLLDLGYNAKVLYDFYIPEAVKMDRRFDNDFITFIYNKLKSHYVLRFFVRFGRKFVATLYRDTKKVLIAHFFPRDAEKKSEYKWYVNLTVTGYKRKIFPFVSKNTVVVYPEITYGNPLNAQKAVRYFLYHNRYVGDKNATGKDDLVVSYREIFNDFALNPDCKTLTVSYFNLDLYRRTNFGERHGTCYIVRKGKNRPDLPPAFDGVVIDNLCEKEKVRVFNECEYCISYDVQTSYSEIAAMCGCKSIIVPEEGKTKNDYRTAEDTEFGISWSFDEDEIQKALESAPKVIDKFLALNESGRREAEKLVAWCEEKWGS